MKSGSVSIKFLEGRRLIELTGIDNDLRDCEDFCRLLSAVSFAQTDNHMRHQLTDCVTTTIFIRYARCFREGVRIRTQKELLAVMEPDDLATHRIIMDIRDKHIAHSVNNLEFHRINVWLLLDAPEKKINSVSVGTNYVIPCDPVILHNLLVLVGRLRRWVEIERKSETTRLLKLVKAKYTTEELYSLIGKGGAHVVRFSDVEKRRRDS